MKNLFPAVLMLLSTCVFADEMQFITVLSTPVGSFNRLEAVDPSAPAQGATVNFCTKIGTEGRVQLKGNNNVGIENTNLSAGTTLGRSNAGDYVLQKITLNSAGSVTGSRLLANKVNVSGQGVGKSDNLYGTTLTVAGGKTKNLNVGNGKSVMAGTGSATEMVWSNEYQNDTAACGTKCNQQYLLKSKGSGSSCSNSCLGMVDYACPNGLNEGFESFDESACKCGIYCWECTFSYRACSGDEEYAGDTCDGNKKALFFGRVEPVSEEVKTCIDVSPKDGNSSDISNGKCFQNPYASSSCPTGQVGACIGGSWRCYTPCPSSGCANGTNNPAGIVYDRLDMSFENDCRVVTQKCVPSLYKYLEDWDD